MSNIAKKIFRGTVLVGSMLLADGAVGLLCPNAKGLAKAAACLASVTIFGAAADIGSKHALDVLNRAQRGIKGDDYGQS